MLSVPVSRFAHQKLQHLLAGTLVAGIVFEAEVVAAAAGKVCRDLRSVAVVSLCLHVQLAGAGPPVWLAFLVSSLIQWEVLDIVFRKAVFQLGRIADPVLVVVLAALAPRPVVQD